jgi:hypothetical protein
MAKPTHRPGRRYLITPGRLRQCNRPLLLRYETCWVRARLKAEDAHGKSRFLDADELGILFSATSVRFVFLAACQTAQVGAAGDGRPHPSRGVAQALVQAGIPAALGMQAVIPAESAVAFAREFYAALADGWPVDACSVEGRRAVMLAAGLGRPDWGIPVLIMRSPDGVIFTT